MDHMQCMTSVHWYDQGYSVWWEDYLYHVRIHRISPLYYVDSHSTRDKLRCSALMYCVHFIHSSSYFLIKLNWFISTVNGDVWCNPVKTRPNSGPMLVHRLRCWPNNNEPISRVWRECALRNRESTFIFTKLHGWETLAKIKINRCHRLNY